MFFRQLSSNNEQVVEDTQASLIDLLFDCTEDVRLNNTRYAQKVCPSLLGGNTIPMDSSDSLTVSLTFDFTSHTKYNKTPPGVETAAFYCP